MLHVFIEMNVREGLASQAKPCFPIPLMHLRLEYFISVYILPCVLSDDLVYA